MFILPEIEVPPGGWQFRQPEIDWSLPNPTEINRNQAAEQLSMIRRANPRFGLNADPAVCLLEIEQAAYMRLQRILPLSQRAVYFYQPTEEEKKKSAMFQLNPSQRPLLDRVAGVAGALGNVLREWQPVDTALATERASVCVKCNQNQRGDWLTRAVAMAGEVIHDFVTVKNQLLLKVPQEEQLGSCLACDCPLRIKIFYPVDRIPMDDELKSRLEQAKDVQKGEPLKCWILEQKA